MVIWIKYVIYVVLIIVLLQQTTSFQQTSRLKVINSISKLSDYHPFRLNTKRVINRGLKFRTSSIEGRRLLPYLDRQYLLDEKNQLRQYNKVTSWVDRNGNLTTFDAEAVHHDKIRLVSFNLLG